MKAGTDGSFRTLLAKTPMARTKPVALPSVPPSRTKLETSVAKMARSLCRKKGPKPCPGPFFLHWLVRCVRPVASRLQELATVVLGLQP